MTDKAYIVANEQQERDVLEVLCINGMKCFSGAYSQFRPLTGFPYVIYEPDNSNVLKSGRVPKIKYSTEIVFDGRKENKMSEKYVVSQEFIELLEEWKDTLDSNDYEYRPLVGWVNLKNLPETVSMWWGDDEVPDEENNNRLIAILRWVNGEDVFKVEKLKKWVVRSKSLSNSGNYWYVLAREHNMTDWALNEDGATKFDTKEEAESWANAHQEVVQVEVD